MQDRPDLKELIESVRRFLEEEVVPAVADQRLRFRARVAANVLAVAARERELEETLLQEEMRRLAEVLAPDGGVAAGHGAAVSTADLRREVEALNGELARRIREGTIAAGPGSPAWEHVRKTAAEKLLVANPAWLERRRGRLPERGK
jgi:hypothetical protein